MNKKIILNAITAALILIAMILGTACFSGEEYKDEADKWPYYEEDGSEAIGFEDNSDDDTVDDDDDAADDDAADDDDTTDDDDAADDDDDDTTI